MSLGHKSSRNPAAIIYSLMNKREKLQDELHNIEKQLETNYLQDSSHFRHVLKGFEGFLYSSKNTTK
ncbi:chromatin modification-related protein eaf6-like [Gossypium australe]|uniref:Chromatin modification-related protein eaf6-like n=1 Tax=Gossypium australe TaxID=47621 RepID=A0A5B6WR89_9ROSI|nr:chromatin modification-related protein eaf6-like [Gossypium australe]